MSIKEKHIIIVGGGFGGNIVYPLFYLPHIRYLGGYFFELLVVGYRSNNKSPPKIRWAKL